MLPNSQAVGRPPTTMSARFVHLRALLPVVAGLCGRPHCASRARPHSTMCLGNAGWRRRRAGAWRRWLGVVGWRGLGRAALVWRGIFSQSGLTRLVVVGHARTGTKPGRRPRLRLAPASKRRRARRRPRREPKLASPAQAGPSRPRPRRLLLPARPRPRGQRLAAKPRARRARPRARPHPRSLGAQPEHRLPPPPARRSPRKGDIRTRQSRPATMRSPQWAASRYALPHAGPTLFVPCSWRQTAC